VTDKDKGNSTFSLPVNVRGSSSAQVFVGAGDIAKCSTTRDEASAQLVLNVLAAAPGAAVFTVGDNAYPDGADSTYRKCYYDNGSTPAWGQSSIRSVTWAAVGNHEYYTGNANGSFGFFANHVGCSTPTQPQNCKGYYSVDLGSTSPWHVIVLNDNSSYVPFASGSAQDTWLQNDLSTTTKQCVIAIWHQPRFFSSATSTTPSGARKILWDRLYAKGADLVLNGHKHHYERFAPQTPTGALDNVNGVREIIVGTGGESTEFPTNRRANSQTRAGTFGVLKLTLYDDKSYTWEFLPIPGRTFTDFGTDVCH
jgi:hypothetical protein